MRKIIYAISALFLVTALLSLTTKKKEKETLVLIKTSYGDIKIKLYNETPLHRDNFIKLVKDALNKIFWRDDSQIVEISARKIYDENSYTDVELEELPNP